MPIVVNPGYVWPPEVDPVVSPDGRITAIVDPAHAGVLLRADFDDSVPDTPAVPEKVLRRNLCTNPSFENSVLPGQVGLVTSSSTDLAGVVSGARCMAMTTAATGTGNHVAVTDISTANLVPGQWVAFGLSVSGSTGASHVNPWVDIRQGSSERAASKEPYSPISPSPKRLVRAVQVPDATFDSMRFIVRLFGSANGEPPADGVSYTDAWVFTVADTEAKARSIAGQYFDGDTPASGNKHYRYASDGTSEEYIPATPLIPGHDATTAKVRFERQDGTLVRSGNPAWAPGGYAHAYDHEATLGGGTLWRAVPIMFDGSEGEPSEYVGAVIPALSDGWAWLKPVSDPDKAMLLKVEPPDLSYDGRVDTTSIAGSARPAATWDVLEGFTTQLRSLVREKIVADQLMALLDEGPVLAQFPVCAGLPDFYFIRGKVDLEHVHWDGYPWRRYQWDVISIDRPDTTDSPLRIPDLSYDTVERDWTTYDQLAATVDSYNKLLEP